MLFNWIHDGRFSAIAASFNPAFERDAAKARCPSTLYMDVAMTAMPITRIIAIVVLLTVCSLCVAEPLIPFGVFSNKESADGEHWGGWEIRTWSQSRKLVGFVSIAEGLIGDEFSAPFQDLQFDSATGRISFWAHLPVINLKVHFSGTLSASQIVGTFILDNGEKFSNVTLKRCCDDAPLFRRFESFEDMAKKYESQPVVRESLNFTLIDIAISGGTMHLTGIKSNNYVVPYPNSRSGNI